jgi:uncharacterized protein (TIGR04255 family)
VWDQVLTPVRPKFANPPLVERAVTVAFEPLDLTIGDYGLFWASLKEEFPQSEAAGPIPLQLEQYDGFRPPQPQIQLVDEGTLPRALFRNSSRGELIQIQPDRFSFNWIKAGEEDRYPHSEAVLRRFFDLLGTFVDFADRRGLAQINPVQCEITNVNLIPLADVGESFVDFATLVRLPDLLVPRNLLTLESQMSGAKFLITEDDGTVIGRVHCVGQPSLRVPTNDLAFRLDITARGAPLGHGLRGVEAFFERAVSAVNGVFLANVTQAGRKFWGEQNA